MAENLIESILKSLSGDTSNRLGAAVGANPQMVQSALQAGVPVLLAGMLQKSSDPQGAGELLDVLVRGNHDSVLGNLGGALAGGDSTSGLMRAGASLLPVLFGNRADSVADFLGSQSGLNRSSSTSLLSLLAPLVMGFVTRYLRSSGGLNLNTLTNLLNGQRGYVRAAAPAGLANILGLRSLDDLEPSVSRVVDTPPVPKADRGWWRWLVGLAILGGLLYALRNCSTQERAVEAPPPPPPQAVEAPAPAPVVPAVSLTGLTLADGTTIQVAPDGVESRLVAFIQDPSQAADTETWFTMDRMEFETGSAVLRPSSGAQLDNIAAILRAYPTVKLKFGGYTDNTGDAAANLQLSDDRARNAVTEVVNRGADAGRLESEGYGAQFPVADNATEEGRQRNRRIDVRVTAK